jgi:hypothetical protein
MRALCLVLLLLLVPSLANAQFRSDFSGDLPAAVRGDYPKVEEHMARAEWDAALVLVERMLAAVHAEGGAMKPIGIELALKHVQLLDAQERDQEALAEVTALFADVKRNFTEWSVFYVNVEIAYANNLANVGRNSEALALALGVTRRVGDMIGADSGTAAGFLQEAATILRRLGHVTEAVEAYRRIMPLLDADPGSARAAAGTMFLIADSLDLLGQGEASLDAFRDAAQRHATAFGPRHSETLAVRVAYGRLLLAMDQLDELSALLDENLPVVAEVFGPESMQYGTWLRLEARRVQRGGDVAGAIAIMDRAVAMLAAKLPPDHRVLAEARDDYAGLLTFDKRYEEAWAQYVAAEGALGPDRKFMLDLLEYRRDAGTLTDAAFAVQALPFLQRAAGGAARGAVREQVLRRLIRDPAIAALYREATDLTEERQVIEASIADLASRPLAEADPAAETQARDRLAEVTEGIRTRMDRVRAAEPAFAELSGEVDLDLAALQALLREDEVIVLLDQQRHDQEWSVIIAITREEVHGTVFWQPVDEMNGWITEVRDSVSLTLGTRAAEALNAPQPEGDFPFTASYQIFRNSLAYVAGVLEPKHHLLIEVRGPLTGLPPGLIVTAEPDATTTVQNAHWLINHMAITVLPSLTSLRTAALAAEAPRAPEGFAGFADPVFDAAEAEALLVAAADTDTRLRGALSPLPETAEEAEAVRAAVAGGKGELWLGRGASEATLKKAGLDRYRMLYFATHGLVSGDRAGGTLLTEPALALTPGEGEDGFLTATEIAQLRLNADWVVMSACNTAAGAEPGAEALSGLAQAFLYAGARSLLVSHWPVESKSAVALMTTVFAERAADPSLRAAEAHRWAMLSMIDKPDDPRWSHPAYWAPFVLVGSPD